MRDRVSPGRPREFDETEVLRKIMTLFWRLGYEGVSLADIMEATGLRKGSLYAAFGDKRSMYLRALAQYEADVVKGAAEALEDSAIPAMERLEAFLSAPLHAPRNQDRSGCFLCNASADQADLDDQTRQQVTRGFDRLKRALVAPLSELNPSLSEAGIVAKAGTLLAVYTGLRVMVRSGVAIEALEPSVRLALDLATCRTGQT